MEQKISLWSKYPGYVRHHFKTILSLKGSETQFITIFYYNSFPSPCYSIKGSELKFVKI